LCPTVSKMATGDPNDYSLIVTILASHTALCMRCLVKMTALSPDDVERLLRKIGEMFRIESATAICDGCLTERTAYRLV